MTASPPGSLEEALEQLYAVPPERFTAERDALVRSLKLTDKQAAKALQALRRPTASAWALNQVARSQPEDLAALFQADEALARAQREGAGRAVISEASQSRREAIRRLVNAALAKLEDQGHPESPANRDRIAQTLAAVAVDQAGREALARGRLSTDLTPGSLWEAGAAPPASEVVPDPAAGRPPDAQQAEEEAAAQRQRELRQQAEEASAEAQRLRAEADRLETEAVRAEAVAHAARSAADHARRRAEQAAGRAGQAQAAAR